MADPIRRRYRGLGRIGTRSLLLLLACGLAVAVAHRLDLRLDWSAAHRFTVAPELQRILDTEESPVELVAVWPQVGDEGRGDLGREVIHACRQISTSAPRTTFTHLDRDDQAERDDFARRSGEERLVDGTLYVRREGRRAFRIPLTPVLPRFLQREVGGALLALRRERATPAYLLQGHGELRPGGGALDGADGLAQRLVHAGFAVEWLDEPRLQRLGRVPDDGILVIPGPTAPIPDGTLDMFRRHLADGGSAALFVDDRLPVKLALLLRLRGVLVGPGFPEDFPETADGIFDPTRPWQPLGIVVSEQAVGKSFDRLLVADNRSSYLANQHPVIRKTQASGGTLLCPRATRVEVLPPRFLALRLGVAPDQQAAAIDGFAQRYAAVGTTPFTGLDLFGFKPGQAWLVSDLRQFLEPPANLAAWPPFALAWAVEYARSADSVGERGGRLLVWGSRQAVADGTLATEGFANETVLTDGCRWLADIGGDNLVPPAATRAFGLRTSRGTFNLLMALYAAVIPCLCIGAAIICWLERRR
jgi:hypothetical protein